MATRTWAPSLAPIPKKYKIASTGVWVEGDIITVTVGNAAWTFMIKDTDHDDVVEYLAKGLRGEDLPVDEFGEATKGIVNFRATDAGEFAHIAANGSIVHDKTNDAVTITGALEHPFSMTVTDDSGVADATGSEIQAADGPSHWGSANNWAEGAVPVDGDDVVFRDTDIGPKYELTQTGVTPATVKVHSSFTGHIGLPEKNTAVAGKEYTEYLATELDWCAAADATDVAIDIGVGESSSPGSGLIKMNMNDSDFTCTVHKTAERSFPNEYSVQLKGTHIGTTLSVMQGNVYMVSGHLGTLTVEFANDDTRHIDADVRIGSGVDITNAAITQTGGVLRTESTMSSATITQLGGVHWVTAGSLGTVVLGGDTSTTATLFVCTGATITSITCFKNGFYDASKSTAAKIVTAGTWHGESGLNDPKFTTSYTAPWSCPDGIPAMQIYNVGPNRSYQIT